MKQIIIKGDRVQKLRPNGDVWKRIGRVESVFSELGVQIYKVEWPGGKRENFIEEEIRRVDL